MRTTTSVAARSAVAATLMVSGELRNHRSTVASAGKKRALGDIVSPQESSPWRWRKPNSMRPSESLRATIRTSSDPASLACALAGDDTAAVPSTATSAATATPTAPTRRDRRAGGRDAPPAVRSLSTPGVFAGSAVLTGCLPLGGIGPQLPLNSYETLRREPRKGPPRRRAALWEPGKALTFDGTSDVTRRRPPGRPEPLPTGRVRVVGLSDAPLSSGECVGVLSGGFVAPHSADDPVGEVAFVCAAGFASGLAFGGFAGEVGGRVGLVESHGVWWRLRYAPCLAR